VARGSLRVIHTLTPAVFIKSSASASLPSPVPNQIPTYSSIHTMNMKTNHLQVPTKLEHENKSVISTQNNEFRKTQNVSD
jgi:hypothetical protein